MDPYIDMSYLQNQIQNLWQLKQWDVRIRRK